MAGLDNTGFTPKTFETIESEVHTDLRTDIDPNLDLSDRSVLGQIAAVFNAGLAEVWEELQAVYTAFTTAASGTALDDLAALTGTERSEPVKTQVVGTVTMDATKALPAGSVAHLTNQPSKRFVTLTEVPADPSGGAFDVTFEAETAGAIPVVAGQLSTIAEAVSGWTGVTNAAGPTIAGSDTESDSELRTKRTNELEASGSSTLAAIKANVIADGGGVTDASVQENIVLHTITVTVVGGTASDIAQAILDNKPAGIETLGAENETAIDSEGTSHEVHFNFATELLFYCNITVTVDDDVFDAVNGPAAIKTAISGYVNGLTLGSDVIFEKVKCAAFDVPGVEDITACLVGFGVASVSTNLTVASTSYATSDVANITVLVP